MSQRRQTFNEINITPLTDIFLVLLIIMMVIAPLLDQQGLNLAVPQFVEEESIKESKILSITVTADNKYMTQDEEIPAESLEAYISANISEFPDGLLIQTDGNAEHGSVVRLMDVARNKGVTNISMTEI